MVKAPATFGPPINCRSADRRLRSYPLLHYRWSCRSAIAKLVFSRSAAARILRTARLTAYGVSAAGAAAARSATSAAGVTARRTAALRTVPSVVIGAAAALRTTAAAAVAAVVEESRRSAAVAVVVASAARRAAAAGIAAVVIVAAIASVARSCRSRVAAECTRSVDRSARRLASSIAVARRG